MKKTIKIISLVVLVAMLIIVVISCGTGVKFNNLIGGSGGGGGNGGNGGNNQLFAYFFDGIYQNDYESFSSIVPTSDGGYFIVGDAYSQDTSPVTDDALFVKLDQNLEFQWSKLGSIGIRGTFGFEYIENQTSYYYACGYANNGFFISKLNFDGSTNKIIYFDNYVDFMLPHDTGIIANIQSDQDVSPSAGIAKFDYNLENIIWYITNIYWGEVNTISNDETVGYIKNTDSDGFLVKFKVSHGSVSDIMNDQETKYIGITKSNAWLYFMGHSKINNNHYFIFIDYRGSQMIHIIKTDNNFDNKKEVSIGYGFEQDEILNISLVPVPNSTNLILAAYKPNEALILVKLDSELNTISSFVKINNFYPYDIYKTVMYFTPLANYFLLPGTRNNDALIYTFDYDLNPACGSASQSNLNLQNTNYFTIDLNPDSHPTLQSGSITVTPANTSTTDYQLNKRDACPIN